MMRLGILLVLPVLISCLKFDEEPQPYDMCTQPYCECRESEHPSWITINCTLTSTKKLDILEGYIPAAATELVVNGGEAVMLGPGALSRLMDLRHVRISGAKQVVLRRGLAVDLNIINAYIEIEDSDVLRVEGKAFNNIRGLPNNGTDNGTEFTRPLSVTIRNCLFVSLEGEAFSWLLKMHISNVKKLMLSPGAFTLDSTAANVGEHGPGMSIELNNLTAPEIPAQAFGSSAAEIRLEFVNVQAIRPGAFSAITYNVVVARNCSFHIIESEAFAQKSLIEKLQFHNSKIHQFQTRALQSAISKLYIENTRFNVVETGSINATVASMKITGSDFHRFASKGFEFKDWNKLYMDNNKFDRLPPNAIVAHPTTVNEFVFTENEIEDLEKNSLEFIGQTYASRFAINIIYKNNYFGVPCQCNINMWLADAMGSKNGDPYEYESYCTVDELFARCFNVPDQNMIFHKFYDKVCSQETTVECEKYKSKSDVPTEIKNPRFPHKTEEDSLSDRNKKVIGIVIVTALGCIIIVMFISLIRWMKRRGHCTTFKNVLLSSNSSCGSFCSRICVCGRNNGIDNTRSISQLSVNEYSERRRLNEPRMQENIIVETAFPGSPGANADEMVPMEDKTTQTLPEELTKELLENLKEKLEDPENYVEAREMIEHLYELIKVEESCNSNLPKVVKTEENIYELPFQNTTPRIGRNKKQMISVGTRAPSLDKLLPLSPYNRQTALAHEYFEPKDFAVHLYAEIANCDKEKRTLLGTIPDIVEQVVPRGPYLRAVREKNSSPSSSPSSKSFNSTTKNPTISPTGSHISSPMKFASPIQSPSSIKSIKSTASNSPGKMINRPLPEKPSSLDPGEGSSMVVG